ncbi:nucleoprotein [Jos virus]|uniref:Nucleoprotein n=1 Tax=Jos virus TaxID=1027466 RepID=H6SW55_9ORTO|nr:nucleoprotein [Jos virus]AED98374.1 nucleoprotein [Jos virus]
MELDKPKRPRFDKTTENQVPKMYEQFQTQMKALAQQGNIDITIDHNADVIGSIVMAACTDNRELRAKDSYYFYIKDGSEWKYTAVELDTSTVTQWAKTTVQTPENKGMWYPFLALLQISSKTKETILWQKYPVTMELELNPTLEVYANGHSIKDRLKNSRPRSVGPLVHLLHLKRLSKAVPKNSKTKRPLESSALHGIKKSIVGHLKRQCIGDTQRMMINQFETGDWSALSTFAASLLAIKPRIENHFVLPYPLLAVCPSFEGASMSSEWVFTTLEQISALKSLKMFGPDASWKAFLEEIYIHSVFQSSGEDLGVLDWMFDRVFHQRRELPKYNKKSDLRPLGVFQFKYKYWSKPLKAAPRTVEGVKRGQISCRPSFKGKRPSYNNFTSIEALQMGSSSSTSTLFEQVQEECQKYMDLKEEGTTCFYQKGSETPAVPNIINGNRYLFG